MSDVVLPIQFTSFGTGENNVITVRSNSVRVSPMYRVRLLKLIRMNSRERTTMKSSVGRRGITSAGTAITTYRAEQNLSHSGVRPLLNRYLSQQVEISQHLSRPESHACQRIFGQGDGETGFLTQTFVEIFQHRA